MPFRPISESTQTTTHSHTNLTTLEKFTEQNNKLYFGGFLLTPDSTVSARTVWVANASINNVNVSKAFDEDSNSRWDTGRGRLNGDRFWLDLSRDCNFTKITFDPVNNDSGLGRIETSRNFIDWQPVVDGVRFGGSIILGTCFARYLRITNSEDSPAYYWSIKDLTLT